MLCICFITDCGYNCYMGYIPISNLYVIPNMPGTLAQ